MAQKKTSARSQKKKRGSMRAGGRPRARKRNRDVEKDYPLDQFVAKIRRLADCIEQGKRFQIQVAGERVSVPSNATINIEHEREEGQEEIEFQLKWSL